MSALKKTILIASILLFVIWLGISMPTLAATQNGVIRLTLGLLFSVLVIIRPKPIPGHTRSLALRRVPPKPTGEGGSLGVGGSLIPATVGTIAYLSGVILDVAHFQWLGLLLLLLSCLHWSLPVTYRRDLFLGFLILYWIHPLPTQVFSPLQLFMQRLSVRGSEWFLHLVNVRAWADGLVLRTGQHVYEVPAWCSGMRTATTVFLLTLGLCAIRRLRWRLYAPAILLGLAQALGLNILRISMMVILVPTLEDVTGTAFLHDTTWIIVLAAIALVYLEMILWTRYARARAERQAELNPELDRVVTRYPPFWQYLVDHRLALLISLLVLAFAATAAFRSRRSHRTEMIKGVAERLRDNGSLATAQRAADTALALQPEDRAWRLDTVRIMIMRNRFEEALEALEAVPVKTEGQQREKDILSAYCLMGSGDLEGASEIIERLPESLRKTNPFVAMVITEIGFHANDPQRVAEHIVTASHWPGNLSRIRSLYPFLRYHHRWNTIAGSDTPIAYTVPAQAMSALEAYMNIDRGSRVADIVLQSMKDWPDDIRLLEPLYFMALRHRGGEWEDRFAMHLERSVAATTDIDLLSPLFEKCFVLVRPDLAWRVYRAIETLDPEHPALKMAGVRHGHRWFLFRKHFLGIAASDAAEVLDIRSLYRLGALLPDWRPACNTIPLADRLLHAPTEPTRKQLLEEALAEFAKRAHPPLPPPPATDPQLSSLIPHPSLTLPMHYEYVEALTIQGNLDRAREELGAIAARHPKQRHATRLFLAGIYERHGLWQDVYETLREDLLPILEHDGENPPLAAARPPSLSMLTRLCRIQWLLKMDLAARYTARKIMEMHPHAPQGYSLLATILAERESAEEALHVLTRARSHRQRSMDAMERQLLYDTERYAELLPFCEAALLPTLPVPPHVNQALVLPPAETSALWHQLAIPTQKKLQATRMALREILPTASSPFFARGIKLWLDATAVTPAAGSLDATAWEAVGRDPVEKASSLHQLTILLCHREQYGDARRVAARATDIFPQSAPLWRSRISLSGSAPHVIREARSLHPLDPEIMLADLAAGGDATSPVVHQLISHPEDFSVAALTRAAEFLFRKGRRSEAAELMRKVIPRARNLLPATFMGIRCAIAEQDREWALECTRAAIRAARHPLPELYKQMVELRLSEGEIPRDADTVNALRKLRLQEPDNPLWAQVLGYVRFQRGGWEIVDALYQTSDAIENGMTNHTTYVVAAEAARRLHNHERAADILRRARTHYPEDPVLLNNLVYTLATAQDHTNNIQEINSLLPELIARGTNAPSVLDTVAVTYLAMDKVHEAETTIGTLLKQVQKGSTPWFHAMSHRARIALDRGKPEDAVKTLEEMFRNTDRAVDDDLLRATRLMETAREKIEMKRREKEAGSNTERPTSNIQRPTSK